MFRHRSLFLLVFLVFSHVTGGEPTPSALKQKSTEAARLVLSDRYDDPLPDGAMARFGTVRLRHSGHVCCLTFSPDGKLIATGAADSAITLWDAATGRQVLRFRGHTDYVESIAFAPDGKTLTAASRDQTVRVWDVESQEELQRFTGDFEFYSVTFSPDGKVVAAADDRGQVRLWLVGSGEQVGEFQGKGCMGQPLAFSPDGKYLICPGGIGALMWEVATGKEVRQFLGHEDIIRALALSRDGKTLATGSQDATIRLWDVATGEQLHTLMGHEKTVTAVAFSADGKTLASRGYDNRVYLWETNSGKPLRRLTGCQETGHSLAFSPDGKSVAVGGHDRAIHLWETATGRERLAFGGHDDCVTSIVFSPNGKTLASGSNDHTVRLWNIDTSREVRRSDLDSYVRSVAVSPDGGTLMAAGNGLHFWDMVAPDLEPRRQLGWELWCAELSHDGKTLACGSIDHSVYVQILGLDERPRQLCPGFRRAMFGFVMALAPDGKILVAGMKGSPLSIYDVVSSEKVRLLGGQGERIGVLTFSPDSKTLVSANEDGTLSAWDPETGEELRRSDQLFSFPISLAFSPDGKTVALGNGDGSVSLWDVASWQERRRFKGHRGGVYSVAFCADGKLLASGGADTTILLWDITDRLREKKPISTPLTPRAADVLWEGLGSEDVIEVHVSLSPLVEAARQNPALILDRVLPLFTAHDKQIKRLIAELNDDRFDTRERASRELQKLEDLAEPALRRTLDDQPTPEVRRRLEELLDKLNPPAFTPRQLRFQRSVEILERVNTDEARRALAVIQKKAPGRWLRDEVKTALLRLEKEPAAQR